MPTEIYGLIRYFNLEQWWLNDLSKSERSRLIETYGDKLIKGNLHSTSLTITSFLKGLASFWKPTPADSILASKIRAKANHILTGDFFDDYWTSLLDDVKEEWANKNYEVARYALHEVVYKVAENHAPPPIPELCKILMHDFIRDDPYYKEVINLVLPIIKLNPNIVQSNLAKQFQQFESERFRYAMYYGEIIGDIYRVKKGRSYKLTLIA